MAGRRGALLTGVALALAPLLAACGGNEVATSSRTIPASCAALVPVTQPPGTDTAGSMVPGTDPPGKPVVSIPPAPVNELQKIDLKVGDGAEVKDGDTVTVQYVGISCSTGTQFDSSWEKGEPATFALAQVIPGWSQGMVGMKVGGQRELIVPPDQGYGANPPQGSEIPKGETLVFVVDLINTGPTPETTTTAAPAATTTAPPSEAPPSTPAPSSSTVPGPSSTVAP